MNARRSRKGFWLAAAGLLAALVLAGCTQQTAPPTASPPVPAAPAPAASPAATPTMVSTSAMPTCSTAPLTVAQTEGPYYKANPPQRASLIEPGMAGTPLVLTGQVMTTDCKPVAGARVDFWQADNEGKYDNGGYRMRGYVTADDQGRYRMETIVPGLYPGRTRHIHVKVGPPGGQVLTTQLYFPNEPGNQQDGLFHRDLVLSVQDAERGREGRFNFVVRPG